MNMFYIKIFTVVLSGHLDFNLENIYYRKNVSSIKIAYETSKNLNWKAEVKNFEVLQTLLQKLRIQPL